MIVARIRAAAERRAALFAGRRVDAFRVVNGSADGAPDGLAIDRYASWLVVSAREELSATEVDAWCRAAAVALGAGGVVLKRLCRDPRASMSAVVLGALPVSPVAIHEHDATFLCNLNDGIPTGLYLDHRETRLRARDFAQGVDVLNLFAYTCAFSVHAVLAGATRVTSVDVSKKALRQGRENMAASGIDPDAHRWFPDDVREHLARAVRRPARYGLVILDPPSFGRADRCAIALDPDLDALVALVVRVTVPGGVVIVSSHTGGITRERLMTALHMAVRETKRKVDVLPVMTTPAPDFPSSSDDDPPQTIFFRVR